VDRRPPAEIIDMIATLHEEVGGFEVASLMSNAWTLPADKAEASMRLFSEEVMPHFEVSRWVCRYNCRYKF
jgi:hypothetical protein